MAVKSFFPKAVDDLHSACACMAVNVEKIVISGSDFTDKMKTNVVETFQINCFPLDRTKEQNNYLIMTTF